MIQEFYIKEVTWATHEAVLRLIREQVFVVEQQVPEALEWDAFDQDAQHFLAIDDNKKPVGCARLLESGGIGRMAVLKEHRGVGVGKALLAMVVEVCRKKGLKVTSLSAQTHAVTFYEAAGFVVCSGVYMDANIDHVDMQLKF